MDRLTERIKNNIVLLKNDTAHNWNKALQKLAEYEDLDEQGLLLRLPCKVGDTIYVNGVLGVGKADEYKIIRVDYRSNSDTGQGEFFIEALFENKLGNSIAFYDTEFGKTVFPTKEQAEQALAEMQKAEVQND